MLETVLQKYNKKQNNIMEWLLIYVLPMIHYMKSIQLLIKPNLNYKNVIKTFNNQN